MRRSTMFAAAAGLLLGAAAAGGWMQARFASAASAQAAPEIALDGRPSTMTPSQIQDVFSHLGIGVRTFSFTLDRERTVRVWSEEYADGKKQKAAELASLTFEAGRQDLMLLADHREKDVLQLKVSAPGARGGQFETAFLEVPLSGSKGGWTQGSLRAGNPTPLWYWASPGSLTWTGRAEDVIAGRARAVVVYAELETPADRGK